MYKTVTQYLGNSHLMNPYSNVNKVEHFTPLSTPSVRKNIQSTTPTPVGHNQTTNKPLTLKWETKQYNNTHDPHMWGPAYWLCLHLSAVNYPENPSPIFRERLKGRILAIPYEIGCPACKPHASAYIEQNKSRLDEIVSSRKNLFNFYVDFHNKVNERYNKKIFSYKEAWDLYGNKNKITVRTLTYS